MFVVANTAILTQQFTVKRKHSTSLEAGYRRDNMADVGVSNARKIVEHCNFVQEYRILWLVFRFGAAEKCSLIEINN